MTRIDKIWQKRITQMELEMNDDSTEAYSSSNSENDDALTISSSNESATSVTYDTSQPDTSQPDTTTTEGRNSRSVSSESLPPTQSQPMDNEPLEGQVFEIPLVNVVQEAVIISRSQEDESVPLNRSNRETTPCSQNDSQIKPIKTGSNKRKR